MFSVVASQATGLSQAKKASGGTQKRAPAAVREQGAGLLRRVLRATARARLRSAERELRQYHQLDDDAGNGAHPRKR